MSTLAYQPGLVLDPAPIAPAAPAIALRPYQAEAIAAVEAAPARGIRRPLVALPTGAGKTVVFAHLAARRGGRTLVLAHRDELIRQAADKLRVVNPRVPIGIVKAEEDQAGAPVVVASVQTLARANRLRRFPRVWDTVIVDEAHHATAPSYRRILEHAGAYDAAGPLALGVTATPERADDAALGDVWQEIVYQRSILDMILEGYLVDLRAIQITLEADLGAVKTRAGDYVDSELESTLLDAGAPEHIVAAYRQHASERKALVFTPTVAMAELVGRQFAAASIPAAAISGETAPELRRQILSDFQAGRVRVLTNCAVLTEGYDEPSVDCVIIARPTKSRPLYVQMVGRGTRLYPGKEDCLIVDLVGAASEHSLVTTASLFDLPADLAGQTVVEALRRRAQAEAEDEQAAAARRASGRLVATPVNLFGRSAMHWIGLGPRDFVLSAGEDMLYLEGTDDGLFDVVQRRVRTKETEVVATGLTLGYAQGLAEDIARRAGVARVLTDPNARWRHKPASAKQLERLHAWGLATWPEITAGEASDLMAAQLATWQRRKGRRR